MTAIDLHANYCGTSIIRQSSEYVLPKRLILTQNGDTVLDITDSAVSRSTGKRITRKQSDKAITSARSDIKDWRNPIPVNIYPPKNNSNGLHINRGRYGNFGRDNVDKTKINYKIFNPRLTSSLTSNLTSSLTSSLTLKTIDQKHQNILPHLAVNIMPILMTSVEAQRFVDYINTKNYQDDDPHKCSRCKPCKLVSRRLYEVDGKMEPDYRCGSHVCLVDVCSVICQSKRYTKKTLK